MFGKVYNVQNRAGRYVQQPGDYKAFIPHPLPPEPFLQMDDELLALLSKADIALGRFNLLEKLYEHPIITVNQAAEMTELSYKNANNIVSHLESLGILTKQDHAERNRRFRYGDYVDVLNEDEVDKEDEMGMFQNTFE